MTTYPKLAEVTKPFFTTAEAAHYLNRKTQTLRSWACFETGAIKPKRIHGRLAWPVDGIRNLVNGH